MVSFEELAYAVSLCVAWQWVFRKHAPKWWHPKTDAAWPRPWGEA
jgi:hypothetical protein